jgi:hypothetical protein
MSRKEFEINQDSFEEHTKKDHNVLSYLFLFIYLNRKDIRECNGLEKFIKESL